MALSSTILPTSSDRLCHPGVHPPFSSYPAFSSTTKENSVKNPRLYGCYVIAPGHTGSFLSPEEMLTDMKAKNMVAAKLLATYSPREEVMGVDKYCVAPWIGIWADAEEGNRVAMGMAARDKRVYPGYVNDMDEVASKHPEISFFLDHAGQSFPVAESYVPLAKKYDNVYLQLTYTSVPEGMLEYLCGEGLAHKTMCGTDAPMRDPRPQLGWVAYANISVEDKKLILGGNMQRVADRCFTK